MVISPRINTFEINEKNFLFILESEHKESFTMDFHIHNFFEIAIVVSGRGYSQRIENEQILEVPIEQDTILFWGTNIPHKAVDIKEDPLKQIIIIFDYEYLRCIKGFEDILSKLKDNNPIILNSHLLNQRLKPCIREILFEIRNKADGKDAILFSNLIKILIQIIRHVSTMQSYTDQIKDKRILKAVRYIHQNYYNLINLEEIANISSLSIRQFSDLFKNETGYTLNKYINWYRIEKAKEFLKAKEQPITDIAFELGYDDTSYFIKRFKLLVGQTPSEYRKNLET